MKYSILILLSCYALAVLSATGITFTNKCSYTIWGEGRGEGNAWVDGTLKKIPSGSSASWNIPDAGLASTRFWAKHGCDENTGANCVIGDQVPNYDIYANGCPTTGCTPPIDSLFEATWGCRLADCGTKSRTTWFDTSQVDGFTLPYTLKIYGPGNNACDCTPSGCATLTTIDASRLKLEDCPKTENLNYNNQFPQYSNQNLNWISPRTTKTVGCMSPCKKFTNAVSQQGYGKADGSPEARMYCCPTPTPNNCNANAGCVTPEVCRAGPINNTQYATIVHKDAPGIYAYSYDDGIGLHTCPSTVTYEMIFCPPVTTGTSASAASSSSSASSSSATTGSNSGCGAGESYCPNAGGGGQCYLPSQHVCGNVPPYLCPVAHPNFCNNGGCC